MNRSLLWLLVPFVAAAVWLALRFAGGEPALAPDPGVANAHAVSPADPVEAATAPTASAEVTRVEAADATAEASKQPPIPDDAIWLEVKVIDAESKQPVAGAEVLWSANAARQQIALLPERERADYYGDQERTAERFGWLTHTDSEGLARIAAEKNGATVQARSEGHYGTAYIGGPREVPKEGWVIELERDLTLRARVIDALGRPAVGAHVAIRLSDRDGKAMRNHGWIQTQQTVAPDAVAEFRHVQRWLRSGTSRKRDMEVAHWKVVPEVPGIDGPAVEFDVDDPPADPVELRLPATGRLAARLIHEGQPFTKGVYFQVYQGEDADYEKRHTAPRAIADEDGWARFAFVAVGGSVVVHARVGAAGVTKEVPAPLAQDQEVRVELTTEELYALRGQFVGPDGARLANETVIANFDLEVTSGGAFVETDAQGRFTWLLPKGTKDTAQIKRLVFSQQFADGTPARTLTVPPREIHRGVNDLGVLQLSNGPIVVAGQLQFDTPQQGYRSWFEVEAWQDAREGRGEARWQRVDGLATSVRPDGSFEVRGETKAVRHRLAFRWGGYLPIAPIEFRLGATDLVIPIAMGHTLEVKVRIGDDVPARLLRGTLRPGFPPPEEPHPMRPRGDRYQAECWAPQPDQAWLRWQGLPSGTYALEISAVGLVAPVVRLENIVLPLPEGGDGRLDEIDLRARLHGLELLVSGPGKADAAARMSSDILVFAMPQADEEEWQGLMVVEGKLVMAVAEGPLELMVVGDGARPQRVSFTAEQVAAGTQTVELRAWPKIDLLFAASATLPEDVVLHAFSHAGTASSQRRRFSTQFSSGGLESYLNTRGGHAEVVDGRASVTVGDGAFGIGVYLTSKDGKRRQSLRSVSPREIQGGDNLAPIAVQLSAEEVAAAVAKLQASAESDK